MLILIHKYPFNNHTHFDIRIPDVAAKGVESEYTTIAAEVAQLLANINLLCIQEAAHLS